MRGCAAKNARNMPVAFALAENHHVDATDGIRRKAFNSPIAIHPGDAPVWGGSFSGNDERDVGDSRSR
jgi:hypothetical protein